jgi:hypothetical protein
VRTVGSVVEFMVELYVSRIDAGAVERAARRARLAADELTRDGTPVRYVRSLYVKEDETCFFLIEADSIETIRELARAALLPVEHVAEVAQEPQR